MVNFALSNYRFSHENREQTTRYAKKTTETEQDGPRPNDVSIGACAGINNDG